MDDPQKRCCLYLRVSGGAGQTTENQRGDVVALARARGLDVVEVYDENASAGGRRRIFDTMLVDAHAGKFNTILVWSLDRFGRSLTSNLSVVIELDRIGVEVVSVREPWLSVTGPARTLMIAIMSWIAEQERRRISERTKAALARLKADGVHVGRPRVSVNVPEALRLRREGLSIRAIARRLRIGASTLHRILAAEARVHKAGYPVAGTEAGETPCRGEALATDRLRNAS